MKPRLFAQLLLEFLYMQIMNLLDWRVTDSLAYWIGAPLLIHSVDLLPRQWYCDCSDICPLVSLLHRFRHGIGTQTIGISHKSIQKFPGCFCYEIVQLVIDNIFHRSHGIEIILSYASSPVHCLQSQYFLHYPRNLLRDIQIRSDLLIYEIPSFNLGQAM